MVGTMTNDVHRSEAIQPTLLPGPVQQKKPTLIFSPSNATLMD